MVMGMADAAPMPPVRSGQVTPTGMEVWAHLYGSGALAAAGEIFTAVIDTSVITGDVIKAVKGGLPSPLLLAMQTGLIRGFMAHHTWAEVPRVLARRASREGVDSSAAERMWWTSYVKVIRFVSTADLPEANPELERALQGRDTSDMPTLRLASLIGPTVILASDRDLQDIGLAYERWWEVPEVVRKVVAGRGSTEFAARAVFGAGYGTFAAVRGIARALQHPPVAIAAVSVIAAGFLSRRFWYPYFRRQVDRITPPAWEGITNAARFVIGRFEEYGAALVVWSSAQRGQRGSSLTHRVARVLATSPKSMTRTEITARLRRDVAQHGHRAVMNDLYVMLHRHQAFCEITRGRWQLGKENANFGGQALAAAPTSRNPAIDRHRNSASRAAAADGLQTLPRNILTSAALAVCGLSDRRSMVES
jgi:hypothetical protein